MANMIYTPFSMTKRFLVGIGKVRSAKADGSMERKLLISASRVSFSVTLRQKEKRLVLFKPVEIHMEHALTLLSD